MLHNDDGDELRVGENVKAVVSLSANLWKEDTTDKEEAEARQFRLPHRDRRPLRDFG